MKDMLKGKMDEMLDRYPQTVISSKYYHEVITTGKMMGRRFGEDIVQADMEKSRILYEVTESRELDGSVQVNLGGRRLTPQEVSAMILRKVKLEPGPMILAFVLGPMFEHAFRQFFPFDKSFCYRTCCRVHRPVIISRGNDKIYSGQ
jgi:hypothetical protein